MIPIPKTLTEGTDNYRLFMALRDGRPKSHHELYALHMIVHSRKSNLVHDHGCLIDTWRDGRTTWYQLRAVTDGTVRAERGQGSAASGGNPSLLGPSLTSGGPTPEPLTGSAHGEGEGLSPAGPGSVFPIEGQAQLLIWEAA